MNVDSSKRGDHYIIAKIIVPKSLNSAQAKLFNKLSELENPLRKSKTGKNDKVNKKNEEKNQSFLTRLKNKFWK